MKKQALEGVRHTEGSGFPFGAVLCPGSARKGRELDHQAFEICPRS